MTEATFTFRVEDDLKAAFAAAAKAQDRTAAQLMRDFMRDYVKAQRDRSDYDKWLIAEVQASIDDPRPSIPAEEIEAEFAARRERTRLKLDKAS